MIHWETFQKCEGYVKRKCLERRCHVRYLQQMELQIARTTEISPYRGQFTTYYTRNKVDLFYLIVIRDSASRVVKSHYKPKKRHGGFHVFLCATKMCFATRNELQVHSGDVTAYQIGKQKAN